MNQSESAQVSNKHAFGFSCSSHRAHRWSKHHRRLCNEINGVEVDLQNIAQYNNQHSDRVNSATASLNLAKCSLGERDYNGGWLHLHNAKRELLHVLSETELSARITVLRREAADKLYSWRKKAFEDLTNEKTNPTIANVVEAQKLIDDHANNHWLKIWTLKSQLKYIILVLSLVAIGLITLAFNQPLFKQNAADGEWPFVLGVILFGILGACVSGVLSTERAKVNAHIPDQVISNLITFTRLAMGGVVAIAAYCFLQMKVIQFSQGSYEAVCFGMAFVSGFSERLVLRTVETLSGKQDKRSKNNVQEESHVNISG